MGSEISLIWQEEKGKEGVDIGMCIYIFFFLSKSKIKISNTEGFYFAISKWLGYQSCSLPSCLGKTKRGVSGFESCQRLLMSNKKEKQGRRRRRKENASTVTKFLADFYWIFFFFFWCFYQFPKIDNLVSSWFSNALSHWDSLLYFNGCWVPWISVQSASEVL